MSDKMTVTENEMQQFEVVTYVTLPLLKISEDPDKPTFIKFLTVIEPGKELEGGRKQKNAEGAPMAPPDVAEVIDLRTNQPAQILVNAVLKSNLVAKYPESGYVGRCFQLRRFKPDAKKRYFSFEILEIRLRQAEATKTIAKK